MATPIQYTPQFIPTNVGMLDQQLGKMQKGYDDAYASVGNAEDKYSEFLVDPSDIEGKNAILGKFQDRTKDIVDKYNGDFRAASKEIARSISKLKADPFMQLAPYKRAMVEEERKRKLELGPNYLGVKSASGTPTYDPKTDKYATKEDLTYDYMDRRAFQKSFDEKYSPLGTAMNEFSVASDRDGYYKNVMRKGISSSDAENLIPEAVKSLMDMDSRLTEEQAMNIVVPGAEGLVGGTTYSHDRVIKDKTTSATDEDEDFNPDAPYTHRKNDIQVYKEAEKADRNVGRLEAAIPGMEKANKFDSDHPEVVPILKTLGTPPMSVDQTGRNSGLPPSMKEFFKKDVNKMNEKESDYYYKAIETFDIVYPNSPLLEFNDNGDPVGVKKGMGSHFGTAMKLLAKEDPNEFHKKAYKKALEPYKDLGAYQEMTANGVSPLDAAKEIAKKEKEMYAQSYDLKKPTDLALITGKVHNDIVTHSANYDYSDVLDGEGNRVKSDDFSKQINASKPISTEFDLVNNKVVFTFLDKDKRKQYQVPMKHVGNEQIKDASDSYGKFLRNIYDLGSITKKGGRRPKHSATYTDYFSPDGNITYRSTNEYDPSSKKYKKSMAIAWSAPDENGHMVKYKKEFDTFGDGVRYFSENAASSLIDSYGGQVEYATSYRNKR